MADTVIDTLQVKVTANAQTATKALRDLSGALNRVRNALTGVKDGATVAEHLSKSLNSVNDAMHGISNNSVKKLDRLSDALQRYADATRSLRGLGNVSIGRSIKNAEKALSMPLKDDMATSTGDSTSVDQTTEQVEELGEEVEKTGKKAKKAAGFFGKFVKSIGRIMFYRAIRSALKAVGEAFDTGLKNAYAFSQQHESFKRLADTMDRMKSSTSQMINQLGALWGEVKQFVLPAIEWISEKLRYGFERMTEFMAAMNGENQYLYARYLEESWNEATDSVKQYKHQLLGLDELNNLSENKSSNKDKDDAKDKYYIKAVSENVLNFASKLKDFAISVSDIAFDWSDLSGEDVAKKIIAGIGGLLGTVVGFSFGGVPGAIIGGIAGVAISATIAKLLFDSKKGKTYSKSDLRKLLYPALGAITGGLIGFTVFKGKGALIGMSMGATLGMVLSKLVVSSDDSKTYSKSGIRNIFYPALGALVGGLIGFTTFKGKGALIGMTTGATLGLLLNELLVSNDSSEDGYSVGRKIQAVLAVITGSLIGWTVGSKAGVGGGVKGALIGASFGIIISMVLNDITPILDKTGKNGSDILGLIEGVLQGITIGVVSWKAGVLLSKSVGSFAGMGIGASLALMLTLLMGEIDYANKSGMTSDDLLGRLIEHGLVGLVGAAIGATITGTGAGAMIGFNVGVSLSMIVKKIDWSVVEDALGGIDINGDGTMGTHETTTIDTGLFGNMTVKKGSLLDQIADTLSGKETHGYGRHFAMGGVPENGTLFYAGESGAEFVGNIGNSSAVANTEQMTEAIYKAAYMGMSKALKENGGNGMSGFEPATTDDLFIAMRRKASNYNKMTGNSAFA